MPHGTLREQLLATLSMAILVFVAFLGAYTGARFQTPGLHEQNVVPSKVQISTDSEFNTSKKASDTNLWLDGAKFLHDSATAGGILVGGVWTYFRFFRGRTFTPRISLQVKGALFSVGRGAYLLITITVENKGNAVIEIDHDETAVAVLVETLAKSGPEWRDIDAFAVLASIEFVEPDEIVTEEHRVRFPIAPPGAVNIQFEVRTTASKPFPWYRYPIASRWQTSCVVIPIVSTKETTADRSAKDGPQKGSS